MKVTLAFIYFFVGVYQPVLAVDQTVLTRTTRFRYNHNLEELSRNLLAINRLNEERKNSFSPYKFIVDKSLSSIDTDIGQAIVGYLGSQLGNETSSTFVHYESLIDHFRRTAAIQLGAIYQTDREAFYKILAISDEAERAKTIRDECIQLDVFGSALNQVNLSIEERAMFNSAAIMATINRVKLLAESVTDLTAQVQDLTSAFNDFQNNTQDELEKIKKNVEISMGIQNTSTRVQDSAGKIGRNPASKPSGTSGNGGGPNSADVERMKVDYNEMAANLAEFAKWTSEGYKIAVNLGMKGKDAERAGKFVQYVGALAAVGKAYASPDPSSILVATTAVTGLFAKPKPSPEQQRHEQIMAALGQIFSNQQIMIENQQKMLELQVELLKSIQKLREENRFDFLQVNRNFQTVLGNQAILLDAIVNVSDRETARLACKSFLNSRFNCPIEYLEEPYGDIKKCYQSIVSENGDFKAHDLFQEKRIRPIMIRGSFSSYQTIFDHFNEANNTNSYAVCREELTRIFVNGNKDMLFAKFYSDDFQTQYEKVISPVLNPLLDLVRSVSESPSVNNNEYDTSFSSFYVGLAHPSLSLLDSSMKPFDARKAWGEFMFLPKGQLKNVYQDLIYVPALERYVNYLQEILPYYDITERMGMFSRNYKILSEEDVVANVSSKASREVISSIRNAIQWVYMAMAQQALLAGDQILPHIQSIVASPSNPRRDAILNALSLNDILAHNFLNYVLGQRLRYSRINPILLESYKLAWVENLKSYKEYLQKDWRNCNYNFEEQKYGAECTSAIPKMLSSDFKLSGKNVVFKVENRLIHIPLPGFESVKSERMTYNEEMYRLLSLRDDLIGLSYRNLGSFEKIIEELPYSF